MLKLLVIDPISGVLNFATAIVILYFIFPL